MTDPETPAADPYAGRESLDFLRAIVADDLREGRHGEIVTRFPPEPNGYLHIGHAKSILLNHGIAVETGGRFHLRFDDTNPETEDVRYVESIVDTVRWLGAEFGEHLYYAADYFDEMYAFAEWLVEEGLAYVDESTEEEIREARGTVTVAGRPTRYRDRPREESRDRFRRMKAGEFPDGAMVLRARIDLASPNMLLRDPLIYRIRHAHHYRTGDRWCVYPLYDYAHPLEDAIEGITHSLCTLEFDNNRAVYDWVVDHWQDFVRARGGTPARPRQYEFARGTLEYTITSKRKLLALVSEGHVAGWDDPRMPTLAGLRRRGVTPEAIRAFWERMGVAKFNSRVDVAKLDFAVRDDLNARAPRVLAVLDPLRVVIESYPEEETETFDAPSWPHDVPRQGSRPLPFSRVVYIERDDFREDPPKGFHRLVPGGEVRLRHAYVVRCEAVVRDESGRVVELRCSHDPATRGGKSPEGRTVKGTIHWVSAAHALPAEIRLYDRLFTVPDPDTREEDFRAFINPESRVVVEGWVEPSLAEAPVGSRYQFERLGYFATDPDSAPERLVFNRTVTLRDSWAKQPAAPPPPAKEKGARGEGERGTERRGAERAPSEPARSSELDALRHRFAETLGIAPADAEVLTRDAEVAALVEAAVELGADPTAVASWIVNVVLVEVKEHGINEIAFTPAELRDLIGLVEAGTLGSAAGRTVLAEMVRGGGAPAEIVERRGLRQVSDPAALAPIVAAIVAGDPEKAEAFRAGRTGLLGYFVGQAMRRSGGTANPETVRRLVEEALAG